MQWIKLDPENLPKGYVIFTSGGLVYLGFFNQKNRLFDHEYGRQYKHLENSYYIEVPPIPEAE
jgi:hypothetical protein